MLFNLLQMQVAGNYKAAKWLNLGDIGRVLKRSPSCENELDLVPLSEGDCGSNVRQLQKRLAVLNLYQGEISGYFDAATRQALEEFQSQSELDEFGCMGTQTWYALTFWSQEASL